MVLTLLKRELFHIVALIISQKPLRKLQWVAIRLFLWLIILVVVVNRGEIALKAYIDINDRCNHRANRASLGEALVS